MDVLVIVERSGSKKERKAYMFERKTNKERDSTEDTSYKTQHGNLIWEVPRACKSRGSSS